MSRFKLLNIYGYHDGLTLFTAQEDSHSPSATIYLFRLTGELDADERNYKADGFDITVRESEIERSIE